MLRKLYLCTINSSRIHKLGLVATYILASAKTKIRDFEVLADFCVLFFHFCLKMPKNQEISRNEIFGFSTTLDGTYKFALLIIISGLHRIRWKRLRKKGAEKTL